MKQRTILVALASLALAVSGQAAPWLVDSKISTTGITGSLGSAGFTENKIAHDGSFVSSHRHVDQFIEYIDVHSESSVTATGQSLSAYAAVWVHGITFSDGGGVAQGNGSLTFDLASPVNMRYYGTTTIDNSAGFAVSRSALLRLNNAGWEPVAGWTNTDYREAYFYAPAGRYKLETTAFARGDESFGLAFAAFAFASGTIEVTTVPEPATFGILAMGMAALAGWNRRKNRR